MTVFVGTSNLAQQSSQENVVSVHFDASTVNEQRRFTVEFCPKNHITFLKGQQTPPDFVLNDAMRG